LLADLVDGVALDRPQVQHLALRIPEFGPDRAQRVTVHDHVLEGLHVGGDDAFEVVEMDPAQLLGPPDVADEGVADAGHQVAQRLLDGTGYREPLHDRGLHEVQCEVVVGAQRAGVAECPLVVVVTELVHAGDWLGLVVHVCILETRAGAL